MDLDDPLGQQSSKPLSRERSASRKPGPWFEIIGVVSALVPNFDAPMSLDNPAKAVVYHTLSAYRTQSYPLYLATHVRGADPTSMLPTMRRIAGGDRAGAAAQRRAATGSGHGQRRARLERVRELRLLQSAIALVLSLAGIYAITSFTVSRRTREIAIRVALGAQIPTIVADVFRAPFFQIAAGVAAGCLMMGSLVALSMRNDHVGVATIARHAGLLFGYGAIMMTVCALACIGPRLRVFRVDSTDVLRDDG
jgi:putative ABC transport system permease protein